MKDEDIEDEGDDIHSYRLQNVASALMGFADVLEKDRVSKDERQKMASTMRDMAQVVEEAADRLEP